MVESIMGRLFIWNLRSPAGAAPAPPAFAMMVGKKSLGVHCHCWSEKGEVILVRQGTVGAELGISAGYLFVSLFAAASGLALGQGRSRFFTFPITKVAFSHLGTSEE